MILVDSNLIIYAASGNYPALVDWMAEQPIVVSAITLVEVLGYPKLQLHEKIELESLFSQLTVLYPGPEVFQRAIDLRQKRKLTLGDALIAGTALSENLTLATHNREDFDWIEQLQLIDPLLQES